MIDAWIEDAIRVDKAKGLPVGVVPILPIHCARECPGLPRGALFRLVGPRAAGVLRKPPRCLPESAILDWIGRRFFFAQRPLQTASVHFDRELFLYSLYTGDSRQTRVRGP